MSQREIHNYKCTLSPCVLNKAIVELHEDPKTRNLEIEALRERLARYPGLNSRLDDVFLLKFLRARKFDQERAFKLVLTFYQMKLDNSDIFTDMYPSSIKTLLDKGLHDVLPNRGKLGEVIIITRPPRWDPDTADITDLFKVTYMSMIDVIEDEETQVNGIRFIVDMKDFTWKHGTRFTPSFAKKLVHLLQDSFPNRLKGAHHVNEPAFFDLVWNVARPFVSEKMSKRFHFHGDKVEELHEYIDPQYLPAEYGGTLDMEKHKPWVEHFLQLDSRFKEDNKFGLVHMQMQQQKQTEDAIEEMAGAYRKLNMDC